MSPLGNQQKKWLFRAVLVVLLASSIMVAEYVAGVFENVNLVRSESRRFVAEAVPLHTYTERLQPNLEDEFITDQNGVEGKRLFRTDSFGFVLGPKDVRHKDSAVKILFLGGSTTENNEVDEPYRFPFLAAFQLSKLTQANFEGVNAGVRGHTSYESLNLYLNHPSPSIREASIVVVMHNINDRLRLTLNETYRSPFLSAPEASAAGVKDAVQGVAYSAWDWGRLGSNILFLVNTVVEKFAYSASESGIRVNERALEAYSGVALRRKNEFEQSIKNIVAVIRANKQTPVLMTQPLGRDSVDQDEFNDVVRKVARDESLALIDLSREIMDIPERQMLFYSDDIHFNNAGSKWAADVIARSLLGVVGGGIVNKPAAQLRCRDLVVNKNSLISSPLYKDVLRGRYPSFDKSENRILFQRNTSDESEIVIFDLQLGAERAIATSRAPTVLEHPTWVDGERVVYTQRSGEDRRLIVFNLGTGKKSPLLANQELQGAIANVGPDGTIYFAGYRQSDQKPPVLYKVTLDGRSPAPLTLPGNESWRPFVNGSREIYFINNETGIYQVYVKTDGDPLAAKRRVFPSEYEQWDPAVSTDGKTLAFAQREGGNFDLFTYQMSESVSKPVRVVASTEDEWDPRFSPSGQYMVYAATSPYGDQIRVTCVAPSARP